MDESDPRRDLTPSELGPWRAMMVGIGRLLHRLDEELVARTGMTLAEYEVLSYLSDSVEGRLRMAELAQGVVVSRSGLTRRVDGLVAAGLVRRSACSSDRRGTYAELTSEGWRRLEQAAPVHRSGVRRYFLDQVDADELCMVGDIFERVASSLAGFGGNSRQSA